MDTSYVWLDDPMRLDKYVQLRHFEGMPVNVDPNYRIAKYPSATILCRTVRLVFTI